MAATTGSYLVGSSHSVCRSPTFGLAGEIQKFEVVVATPPVDVPLTTNVTSIKVHIAYSPFQASTRY